MTIIKMLNVIDDKLVVEEKALYSIEKFLMARRIMYWQVYLHKAVLSAEQMLILLIEQVRKKLEEGIDIAIPDQLKFFFLSKPGHQNKEELIKIYSELDDIDIMYMVKSLQNNKDFIISFLAKSIVNRKIFKVKVQNQAFKEKEVLNISQKISDYLKIDASKARNLIISVQESNLTYSSSKNEIFILQKNTNKNIPLSKISGIQINTMSSVKHFLCFPKLKS